MFVYDIIPPEKLKKFTKEEVLGIKEYKTKSRKYFAFSRRAILLFFITIFFISGLSPINLFQKVFNAISGEEKTVDFYSIHCSGEWGGPENAQGRPEVGPKGEIDLFSEDNSAFYQGGAVNLICQDFNFLSKESEEVETAPDSFQTDAVSTGTAATGTVEQIAFSPDFSEEKAGEDSTTTKISSMSNQSEEQKIILGESTSTENTSTEQLIEFETTSENLIKSAIPSVNTSTVEEAEKQSITSNKFLSAKVKLSFAVEEQETASSSSRNNIEYQFSTSSDDRVETTSTESGNNSTSSGVISFWEKLKNFFGNFVFKSALSVKAEQTNGEETEDETEEESQVEEMVEEEEDDELSEEEELNSEKEELLEPESEAEFEQEQESDGTATGTVAEDVLETTSTENMATDNMAGKGTTTDATATEIIVINLDPKIIIWYSLDGELWEHLGIISSCFLSNGLNEDYFAFDAPFLKSWEDVKNLKIKFEGVIDEEKKFRAFLDSIWIETTYQQEKSVEGKKKNLPRIKIKDNSLLIASFSKNDFHLNEEPVFIITEPDLTVQKIQEFVDNNQAEIIEGKLGGEDGIIPSLIVEPIREFSEGMVAGAVEKFENLKEKFNHSKEETEEVIEYSREDVSETDIKRDSNNEDIDLLPDEETATNTESEFSEEIFIEDSIIESGEDDSQEIITEDENDGEQLNGGADKEIIFENSSGKKDTIINKPANFFSLNFVEAQTKVLKATIFNFKGEKINFLPEINSFFENGKEKSKIKIPKPKREFNPGIYTLEVEIETDEAILVLEQDFSWGVLAINTNKSIYLSSEAMAKNGLSGETAYLQMAVLDDAGMMVCDANLTLEIISPLGEKTILKTSEGTIIVNPECRVHDVTKKPDYEAHYIVEGAGEYKMNLTALTKNGIRSITDTFEARDSVPFDVERQGPTRILPIKPYTMKFIIKVNQDFDGIVRESVPESFDILKTELFLIDTGLQSETDSLLTGDGPKVEISVDPFQIISRGNTKTINWTAQWKKNQLYELSYQFDAPDVSPYLYLLGPFEIGNFQEIRQWQIASDADIAQIEWGVETGVTSTWKTVNLNLTFTDPIVVASALYNYTDGSQTGECSIEADVQSVTSSSFQVRMSVAPHDSGGCSSNPSSINVHWLVAENTGTSVDTTIPGTSIKIQAGSWSSTSLDENNSWTLTPNINLYPSFTDPIAIHQRVTWNDSRWANTWACEANDRDDYVKTGANNMVIRFTEHEIVPSSDFLSAETLHYIVLDGNTTGTVSGDNGSYFQVLRSGDAILGLQNSIAGYSLGTLSGFSSTPEVAVGSQQEMDGGNGGWFVSKSISTTDWRAWSVEDQDNDAERNHINETTGGIVFETAGYYPSISNNNPSVSAVNLTPDPIILTENTTTTVNCTTTLQDNDGWSDIATGTAVIYRDGSDIGTSSCSANDNNCYSNIICDLGATTTNTRDATCTANLWFHAEATDASSSYSGETWQCEVTVIDNQDASATGTDSSPPELYTQYALIVDYPINYGTVFPSASSTATSTRATTTGNSAIDLNLYGVDMASGTTYTIPVGNQEYASSSFTHSGGTSIDLAVTPGINYNLELGKPTSHPSTSSDDIYWSLYVDVGQTKGTYTGTTTISAVAEIP